MNRKDKSLNTTFIDRSIRTEMIRKSTSRQTISMAHPASLQNNVRSIVPSSHRFYSWSYHMNQLPFEKKKNMKLSYALLVRLFVVVLSLTSITGRSFKANPLERSIYSHGRKLAVAIEPQNLKNHGGSVMSEGINLYVVWYGAWNTSTVTLVESFLGSLGNQSTATLEPNLGQWWSILSEYTDPFGGFINGNITYQKSYFDTAYSSGVSLEINNTVDVYSVLSTPLNSSYFPVDGNGIYIIMTSSEVNVTNSCTFCSNIGYILYNLEYLKILWYHDTSLVCPITCSALNSKTLPPNGDFVGDSATNSIAIQLSNLATNPLLSTGWYDDQGLFIGSLCKFTFGTTFTDSSNSGTYNIYGNGNNKYLISQVFDLTTNSCVLAPPNLLLPPPSSSQNYPPPPPSSSKSGSSSSGIIIGVAIGVVLLVIIAISIIVCCCCAKRRNKDKGYAVPGHPGEGGANSPLTAPLIPPPRLNFQEVSLATDSFSPANLLEKGDFGEVYKGYSSMGEIWAILKLTTGAKSGFVLEEKATELYQLSHPSLVPLKGFCDEGNEKFLIFSYMENFTLRYHLDLGHKLVGAKVLPFSLRVEIAIQTAEALSFLHSKVNSITQQPLFHGQLTSTSILLDNQYNAKVSKYCLPGTSGDEGSGVKSYNNENGYNDPEVQSSTGISPTTKSDVFSFGVILLELTTGKGAVTGNSGDVSDELLTIWVKRILTNGTIFQVCDPALGSMVPAETLRQLVLLAQKCTALQGRLRPSMKEVVTLLKDIKSHYKRLMSSGDVEDSFESSFGVTGLQSSTTGNGDVESSSGFKAPISFAPKLR